VEEASRGARSRRTLAACAVFLSVAVAAALFAISVAGAAPGPPPPSITGGPADPTNQTSATFTFTDTQAGVTFQCSLDNAAYAGCTSPRTYTGLAAGNRDFKVKALQGTAASGATNFKWTIDLTPPAAPTFTSTPASPSSSSSATFDFTNAKAGVTYLCSLDGSGFAACPDPVTYTGLTDGSRTFEAEAKDPAGNVGPSATFTWTIDTVPPPVPSIGSGPPAQTTATTASFAFSDTETGVTFLCSLDGAAFAACTSPKAYSGLSNASHTFQLEAKDAAGNVSAPASSTWFVGPATPTITAFPPSPSNSNAASFGFTSPDSGVVFQCKLDGAAYAACTSPKAYTGIADGSHTFSVQAKVGQQTSRAATSTWTVDTTPPPAPSISSGPANPTNQTSASFAFTDTDGTATFLCSLDGAGFAACASPKSYPGPLSAGSHTFRVEAKDPAGNVGAPTSFTWTIDTTAPVVTVTFPAAGGLYSAASWNAGCAPNAGICGSATDPSGVTAGLVSIQRLSTGLYWNGTSFGSAAEVFDNATASSNVGTTFTGYYPLSLPPDGSYTVHVRATDGAGNTTPAGSQVSLTFTIDTSPPAAPSISSGPASPTNVTSASFQFSGEAGASFLCRLDGGAFAACASPQSYAGPLAAGSHTFQVEAKDAAGNVGPAASYAWTIDLTPPAAPTITAKPSNPSNVTAPSFSFTGEAGASFLCKLDGGAFAACSSPQGYSGLAAGSHTFQVEAKDAAGNVGPAASYAWTIDLTPPPVPSITAFPPGLSSSASASFSFSDGESGVTFVCLLDTGVFTACTSPKSYTGVADGGHTFYVAALDAAGNQSTPASYAWTVDTTPPAAPTITSGPSSPPPVSSTSATFTFAGEPGASLLCKLDAAAFVACTSPASYSSLAQGAHTFQVEAKDAAGNVGPAATRTWTVDTVAPPVPTITSSPASATTSTSVSFSFTDAESGVTFSCSLDGAPAAPCTSPKAYSGLSEAVHTFVVYATDAAGNQSAGATFAWAVDLTPPSVVSITRGDPTPTNLDNVSWTVTFSEPVRNVNAADFQLVLSGLGTGPAAPKLGPVTPAPGTLSTTWDVTASTGTGAVQGTLGLNLVDDDSIADAAGNRLGGTGAGNGNFTGQVYAIDHVAPPTPTYTTSPPNPSSSTTAVFAWSAPAPDVVEYQCGVEDGPFYECTSPQILTGLSLGDHEFEVYAVDAAGNQSPDNEFHWRIVSGTVQPVTIAGDAVAAVFPGGPAVAFATQLSNPNAVPVTVTSLATTRVDASFPAGCSPGDFSIIPSNASLANPITIPASGSVTLPDPIYAPGVTPPMVLMADDGNQDACAGATFTVSYGGAFVGHATVGTSTHFVVAAGPASGPPLLPTTQADPSRIVNGVPVTVTNPGTGDENLHQLLFEVTPGWVAHLAGHPDCTANDFSIDGRTPGSPDAVVVDQELAPGGHYGTSFTVQLVENNADQNACQGQTPSFTVVAT
jgi:hypothetical protein